MRTEPTRAHICFGSTDEHVAELERCAAHGARPNDWWTIHKGANPGDRVAFYMISPRKSFIATAIVAEKPYHKDSDPFAGKYRAHMENIRMLSRPVHLHEARARFPDWTYLRLPRRSASVPSKITQRFLDFLDGMGSKTILFAEASDFEGLRAEVTQLRSTRSKRLRKLAIQASSGICAVCRTDFSNVLGGRGVRVLHVHHRKQLSARSCPAITRLSDLAVVCANCHMLLHLDGDRTLSINELRQMLRRDDA